MTLEQLLEQWEKGLQIKAKLSSEKESFLIIHFDGKLVLSGYIDDILRNNWEVDDVDIIG